MIATGRPHPPFFVAPPTLEPRERRRSLQRVALHEYAHYHVARSFGIRGRVEIAPRVACEPGVRELFSGCFVPVVPMIECHAAQVIGLAGLCADARPMSGPMPAATTLLAWLARGALTLSASDALQAGEYGEAHVTEALGRVAGAWTAIERDASAHAAALAAVLVGREGALATALSSRVANGTPPA